MTTETHPEERHTRCPYCNNLDSIRLMALEAVDYNITFLADRTVQIDHSDEVAQDVVERLGFEERSQLYCDACKRPVENEQIIFEEHH